MSEIKNLANYHFFIFRHGLATLSTAGYGDQVYSAPLLDQGIPSIDRLATYLQTQPCDVGYSSEVLRCRQTAEIVTRFTGKQFQFDKRLNEYHQEEFTAFVARVTDFLNTLPPAASSAPQSVWICTHGAVIAALKHLLLDGIFTQDQELDYTKPGEILEIVDGQIQVHSFN